MKISYKHIIRCLEEKPSLKDLSEKLFQLGHEHDVENDIFNFEFTPNRGDCLSVNGVIRDLSVFYKNKNKPPIYDNAIPNLDINFSNLSKDSCPSISFIRIKVQNVHSEYKEYLNSYFEDLNIKKNNFFTDISNYIAYEQGQPVHSYDFNLINGPIILRNCQNENEKFLTLTNTEIELHKNDLVFYDSKGPINLAGVMGGMRTSCSKDTNDALIECAYFKPEFIIGKSVKYDLHSDASHKFERSVDPLCQEKTLRRFIQIVQDHAEIFQVEIFSEPNTKYKKTEINYDLDLINKILGTKVEEQEFVNILSSLDFKFDGSKIVVPSYRSDISHQNDLAEEIARVIGYNNIESKSILLNKSLNKNSSDIERQIKSYLINNGFYEVINMPFNSFQTNQSIKVDNPLDSNREFLRTELVPSLIENVVFNEKRQKESVKFFEISDIYILKNKKISCERRLGLVVSGRQGLSHQEFSKKLDKKYLVKLFNSIGINLEQHILLIDRDKIDSKIKTPIFAFEVPLDDFPKITGELETSLLSKSSFAKYKEVSDYPSSYRDFSFSIENKKDIPKLYKCIEETNVEFLKDYFIFDYYEDIHNNKTKVGYRFIFQSNIKTLKDEEINNSVNNLLKPILSINSITVPGL